MSGNGFSRRDFLKTGIITSLVAGTGSVAACNNGIQESSGRSAHAKNVIFMVSDGMSIGTLTMADIMIRSRLARSSHWVSLYDGNIGKRSLMDMASLNSTVTDSAAAASSWGCGRRIINGGVNVGPQGEVYKPILPIFKDAGKSTGLVSTTRITHATPAGFLANVTSRNDEDTIAEQFLDRGADILMGGGLRHFDPKKRPDGKDLVGGFLSKGYNVVTSKSEMISLENDGKPTLGLFTDGHLPYTVDHNNIPDLANSVPTLSEMTEVALDRLSKNSNGFILQVEGGRVDHAAHTNDAAGLVFDQIAFDHAIGTALKFVNKNPDTLLIITSDHGNANPGLNAEGPGYNDSPRLFNSLSSISRSFEWMFQNMPPEADVVRLREFIATYTNYPITIEQTEYLQRALDRKYRAIYHQMSSASAVMGQILANFTGINFIGSSHTADYVELFVMGPGSERITGFTRNTSLFNLMTESAGIRVNAVT